MKKRKINWKYIFIILPIVILFVFMGLLYAKLSELTTRLTYLQDSTSIILSDVDGMQSNIEKTLKQETSTVESYTFDIIDMDFEKKTYDISVTVIPKEYTEKTEVSVFFGTEECKLRRRGYVYMGRITLPLENSFNGNVTFLIANNQKKMTEVLEHYEGIQTNLDKVLSGQIDRPPTCKDEELRIKGNCSFELDGAEQYQFKEFELVAALDDEEIQSQDMREKVQNPDSDESEEVESTETQTQKIQSQPFAECSGEVPFDFSYELGQEDEETREIHRIRIFLRAVTTDGYRFEYTVFQGNYMTGADELDKGSYDFDPISVVYDSKGGQLELDISQTEEVQ